MENKSKHEKDGNDGIYTTVCDVGPASVASIGRLHWRETKWWDQNTWTAPNSMLQLPHFTKTKPTLVRNHCMTTIVTWYQFPANQEETTARRNFTRRGRCPGGLTVKFWFLFFLISELLLGTRVKLGNGVLLVMRTSLFLQCISRGVSSVIGVWGERGRRLLRSGWIERQRSIHTHTHTVFYTGLQHTTRWAHSETCIAAKRVQIIKKKRFHPLRTSDDKNHCYENKIKLGVAAALIFESLMDIFTGISPISLSVAFNASWTVNPSGIGASWGGGGGGGGEQEVDQD